ncbi:hypothetical protein [Streptomyces scabichelini]|uniref:hypothetical protein n=1 Tax=Streptomyces scabichelini TaxID=2711217 RepID=UPI0019D1C1A2|nr:hypothetical protein [Streptomyces scabichelini]
MAYRLRTHGAEFELHYFARSREEAAFVDLLERRAEFRDAVRLHFGVPRGDQPVLLSEVAAGLTPAGHVYTCGPQGFMEQVTSVFAPVVGEDHVHMERFVAAEVDTSGNQAFTVELDTGEVFEIPADKSILAVLEANGIDAHALRHHSAGQRGTRELLQWLRQLAASVASRHRRSRSVGRERRRPISLPPPLPCRRMPSRPRLACW